MNSRCLRSARKHSHGFTDINQDKFAALIGCMFDKLSCFFFKNILIKLLSRLFRDKNIDM